MEIAAEYFEVVQNQLPRPGNDCRGPLCWRISLDYHLALCTVLECRVCRLPSSPWIIGDVCDLPAWLIALLCLLRAQPLGFYKENLELSRPSFCLRLSDSDRRASAVAIDLFFVTLLSTSSTQT